MNNFEDDCGRQGLLLLHRLRQRRDSVLPGVEARGARGLPPMKDRRAREIIIADFYFNVTANYCFGLLFSYLLLYLLLNYLQQRKQRASKQLGRLSAGAAPRRRDRLPPGLVPEHRGGGLSCDIHTHTPAQKSSTSFILYPSVSYTDWLGHGHGYEWHSSRLPSWWGATRRGRGRPSLPRTTSSAASR